MDRTLFLRYLWLACTGSSGDRALASGARGRRFESSSVRHSFELRTRFESPLVSLPEQLAGHIQGLEEVSRGELRSIWQDWSLSFCGRKRGKWDEIGVGNQSYGRSAIKSYSLSSPTTLYFGSPDQYLLFCGSCQVLPPYGLWLELYRSHFDDDLYIWAADCAWTLAIHHEQFGGLVKGPIWSESIARC